MFFNSIQFSTYQKLIWAEQSAFLKGWLKDTQFIHSPTLDTQWSVPGLSQQRAACLDHWFLTSQRITSIELYLMSCQLRTMRGIRKNLLWGSCCFYCTHEENSSWVSVLGVLGSLLSNWFVLILEAALLSPSAFASLMREPRFMAHLERMYFMY